MRTSILMIALVASACAYEPLVCDETRADEVAFLFVDSGGFFRPYLPHGAELLVIDGSCRYHVYAHRHAVGGVLRSGVLTSDELDAINDDLLTVGWSSLDGQMHSPHDVSDAETYTFRRDAIEASCYSACDEGSDLERVRTRAPGWIDRLWERGTALDGAVAVVGRRGDPLVAMEAIEWTGEPLEPRLAFQLPGTRIEGADAATLRALRDAHAASYGPPLYLRESDVVLHVGVADVLPFEIEALNERHAF